MSFSFQGAASAFAVLVCLSSGGCAPESLGSVGQADCLDDICSETNACDGDDPETFCDDCNPCTQDFNCTPCSELDVADRDVHHCVDDGVLSPMCAKATGCIHVPLTTPEAQINACFPVADDPDLHAGVCDAGACIENPR